MELTIPHFLNKPDKIVFWTWREVYCFLSVLFVIWLLNSFLLGLLFGAVSVKVLKALQKHPLGDLTRLGPYWFLGQRLKTLPCAYIREFLG